MNRPPRLIRFTMAGSLNCPPRLRVDLPRQAFYVARRGKAYTNTEHKPSIFSTGLPLSKLMGGGFALKFEETFDLS